MSSVFPAMAEVVPAYRPEAGKKFVLKSDFQPAGDQPAAIRELVAGLQRGERDQVLLGVTGSGKTFTAAQVIHELQRPAIILAPNKTLAAQLYGEMKQFFPDNAVEYFVSFYDYYQPEAYIPRSDTFIEKDSMINEQIDRMRHAATRALLERDDVIIVASVSCIYGIGSVETYSGTAAVLAKGQKVGRQALLAQLVELQYKRNDIGFSRGDFRARGDTVDIFPAHMEDRAWRISTFDDEIEEIVEFDPLTGEKTAVMEEVKLYANSHYVTPKPTLAQAIGQIKVELKDRLQEFTAQGKLIEEQRLRERTQFDLEMLAAAGVCSGIENYSRYLTGRAPGQPPPTLFEYLPPNALLFVDESHAMVPQLNAMYRGDLQRKTTLADYGFRLPSCRDNRPLKFEEWERMRPQTIFVSATPGAMGTGAHRRRLYRAGRAAHRPDRSAGRHPPDRVSGRRFAGGNPRGDGTGLSHAGDDAHQENGRGADRIYGRGGDQGALSAFRRGNAGAQRDHSRFKAWRV